MKLFGNKNIVLLLLIGISVYAFSQSTKIKTNNARDLKTKNVAQSPLSNTSNSSKLQPGLWFDPSKNGHGFVIEPIGFDDLYFTIFFTYKEDGTPEWYTSLSVLEDGVLNIDLENNTLQRFNYDSSIDPQAAGAPNVLDESIGTNILSIDFNSTTVATADACNDTTNRATDLAALATWQLGDKAASSWCIEPIIALENYPSPYLGGSWWTGIDDDGWGMSIAFANDELIAIVYYYDQSGKPRWVIGQAPGFKVGEKINFSLSEVGGYARDAEPITTTYTEAGTMSLIINNNSQNLLVDGVLDINVNYLGAEGGNWARTDVAITNLTAAHDLKKFITSFESAVDFSGFYITPQAHKNTTFHELSDSIVHSGTFSHKAWITGANPPSNATTDNNHRGYPTVQLQNTEVGVFQAPLYVTLWVWLDMELRENPSGENDWFSFATFTDDETDNWSRTVLVNLGPEGFVHLMHTTDQGVKEHIFQTDEILFPQRQWVELKMYLDFSEEGYAKVWQNGQLVSHALIGNIKNQLAQAHFGLYSAPQIEAGVVYNDDLKIEMVRAE